MVADERGVLIIACARGGSTDYLIAVGINLQQVVARYDGHILKTNGALQCSLQSPLHSSPPPLANHCASLSEFSMIPVTQPTLSPVFARHATTTTNSC